MWGRINHFLLYLKIYFLTDCVCGKLLALAIYFVVCHSFWFLAGESRSEGTHVLKYLYAAILYSVG